MESCARPGNVGRPGKGWFGAFLLCGLAFAVALTGCCRAFYRKAADKEVVGVLKEKDKYEPWKIQSMWVYPDPRARFADPTNPDKPPMPPDDPAARDLSPNPQHPPLKGGVAWVEGNGYLELLGYWDQINRALRQSREAAEKAPADKTPAAPDKKPETLPPPEGPVRQASFAVPARVADAPAPERLPDPDPPPGAAPPPEQLPPPQPAEKTPAAGSSGAAGEKDKSDETAPRPFLLTADQAAELALFNSREFQTRREDLYLSALPVTLERFAFAAIPELFGQAIREVAGSQSSVGKHNRWIFNNTAGLQKLFSTGALLLFQFANQTVVELTGNHRHTTSVSTINLDIVQPLLRGGGKAVTLEPLTQVERNLLYEIRDYARFRKLFFVRVIGGADVPFAVVPAAFGGPNVLVNLPNFGSGANAFSQIVPGIGALANAGSSGLPAPAQGFLPTLQLFGILQNSQANVRALETILERFRAFGESGTIPQLQIDQVEQQLLQGQSDVLQRGLDYRNALDQFKLQLGVPTNLPLELDDGPLRPIVEHMRRYERLFDEFTAARNEAERGSPETVRRLADPTTPPDERRRIAPDNPDTIRERLRRLFTDSAIVRGTRFRETILKRWASWEGLSQPAVEDLGRIQPQLAAALMAGELGPIPALPSFLLEGQSPIQRRLAELRAEQRTLLDKKAELQRQNRDLPEADRRHLQEIGRELDLGRFELVLRLYEARPWEAREKQLLQERQLLLQRRADLARMGQPLPGVDRLRLEAIEEELPLIPRQQIRLFRAVVNGFALVVVEAQDERLDEISASWPELPRTCLEGADLLRVGLDEAQDRVGQAALVNRVDLMNARAEVVDAWRKIAVLANQLLGVFNVAYHLDTSTPPNMAKPLDFSGRRTRHDLILNYDLPLVRKVERNNYRAALIAYQRQRRALMSFEDGVLNDVRSEIRSLRVLAENYKIQQRQVELAYSVRDNSFEVVLEQPADPNQPTDYTATTNQLLQAQTRLLTTQNLLYTIWIQYLTARLQLYRDLELLPLDDRGVWIDDVATRQCPGGPGTSCLPSAGPERGPSEQRGDDRHPDAAPDAGPRPQLILELPDAPERR